MIYQINNGLVKYSAETILDHINFEIRNTEKIAVVGRNGCGKTTLFKLIAGLLPLDNQDSDEDGWISKGGNITIGFLQQISFENEDLTVEEELMKAFTKLLELKKKLDRLCIRMETDQSKEVLESYSKTLELLEHSGGYTYQSEMETVVTKFGFALTDLKRPIKNFSGGQRTKLAFIQLLLCKPDILLLDEPTNHLDLPTIEWLEQYLKQYPKAVVIISHDRTFLDKIADVTYEIEHRKMIRYQGNYSAFVKQKRLNWDKQQKDYQMQQKEITRLMTLIEKYKHHPTKVAMTKSKLKQIEHMDLVRAPENYDLKSFHADFKPLKEGGQEVLKVNRLVIGYDKPLCEVSFELKKGQRLAVIGENGIGKSTLLKTLVRQVNQLEGTFFYGFQIEPGYYDQQPAKKENDRTVLEDFCEEFPDMLLSEARSALGAFLFTQDTVYKKVCQLSGGERVRLSLSKILKKRPNLLILDEPTNHMDIIGKEAFETMLMNYEGTVLFVSHDRYFVQKIADSLLIFEKDKVSYYPFGYQELTERKLASAKEDAAIKFLDQTNTPRAVINEKEWDRKEQNRKEQDRKEQDRKSGGRKAEGRKAEDRKKQEMRKLELRVEETEREIERIKALMENPEIACDYAKLSEINEQLVREERKLEAYIENYVKEQE
ncbi:ABC-F family ATP-binding cassette domain-containing protein [Anaerocolumna sp. AGMB13025]|uniref:ABC-F family ATP-binding cassette domain-containing protein n=1 Tax=Anaerocolumna sp. AGMB13025 TaxID=3039116 RepID=UPI00241E4B6F|nr:ABC-F family ATP-binding cassette domain-containing protein [Anaerocolumna sp. AGMB13025]WFR57320.1 ABC-F family ATP-binding cassette domain-containing protein [Anaerocolumna sp. AGMB13025]